MRLTLRTLLAYLDEILDPHDAEQLRNKIGDSEFATSLVHQIRGSVRRLRLDAPRWSAQGIGADLNSVAEYLDNTLPPDHVPALEKICLDNEIHLGEVAASHQILTLVLGQAADISESLRNRVYAIAPTVEHPKFSPPLSGPPAPHIQPTAPSVATPPAAAPGLETEKPVARANADRPVVPSAAPTPDTSASALPPDATASPPGAPPARPSERFAKPTDMPSTKEAWRAEALQHAGGDTATDVQPVAAEDPDGLVPAAAAKKSSWLRTLTISALIVILIVAGLLAATGPINQTLVRWLRLDAVPVATQDEPKPPTTPAFPRPETPPETLQIERAETSPMELTETNEASSANTDSPVAILDAQSLATAERPTEVLPLEPVPAITGPELFPPSAGDPRLLAETNEDEEAGEESGFPSLEPATGSIPTTDRRPTEISPAAAPPDDVVVDLVEVDPNFPPKRSATLEVPDGGAVASARAESSLPRAIDDATGKANRFIPEPITAPELDLNPVPVNPPVASPAPAASADATLFPAEPAVPEPQESRVLEPTRLRSGDQLLLVFDPAINDWKRLDATLPMSAGESLLSLPAFRADLEVGSHFTCTMVGATRLRLGPQPYLTLDNGQLMLKTKTANRAQGIQHRGEVFDIWTAEPEGVVTIEASRVLVPGSDPMEDLSHTILRIHALTNDASVRFKGQTFDVPEGQQLLRLDNFAPRVEAESRRPKWTSAISISRADASTVRDWKGGLNDVENMRLWLQQRAINRHYNERALASRCLAEMDQFDAIVAALNDEEQRAYWDQQFETVRRALSRGPEAVQRISLELEKAQGPAADELLEMIRGYNERQLAQGAAAQLVANLEHEKLVYRVLAIQNLKRITSFTHLFRAEEPIGRRRGPVKKWNGKLKSGLVTYAKPPGIVTLLNSFTQPATTNVQ